MSEDDSFYFPETLPNAFFGEFPDHFRLLKGAVTVKIPDDVCVQEYLFHRFKEPAFADYEEGDDIYISDRAGIWIELKIERFTKHLNLQAFKPVVSRKRKRKKSKLCSLLRFFCCIAYCKDDDTVPYNKKSDESGYEADGSDCENTDSFKPLDLDEEEMDIEFIERVRDYGFGRHPDFLAYVPKFLDEI